MVARRALQIRQQLTSRRVRYAAPALDKGLDILELLRRRRPLSLTVRLPVD